MRAALLVRVAFAVLVLAACKRTPSQTDAQAIASASANSPEKDSGLSINPNDHVGPWKGVVDLGSTDVQVRGALPPEIIVRIVRQNLSRFRLCYDRGRASVPDLAGKITVDFVIDSKGNVTDVTTAAPPDWPSTPTTDCVVHALRAISFPAPDGGIVRVTYPMKLVLDGP